MKQKIHIYTQAVKRFCRAHARLLITSAGAASLFLILIILVCYWLVAPNRRYILPDDSTRHVRVGLVLGAGVTKDGRPFRELQSRLDSAAEAYARGQVDMLIVSGDNRFKDYDEPTAMLKYLVETKDIPAIDIQPDFAGRSTYESCERAAKIFGLQETIIFSARSHLPRAIYLCRHFGIEAYGMVSPAEANNGQRRELQANVKAVFNVYLLGERTVLGERIKL